MGTSTRWPGPKGGPWTAPNRKLGQVGRTVAQSSRIGRGRDAVALAPIEMTDVVADRTRQIVDECVAALQQTIRADPDTYELRTTMVATGKNLVDALDDLHTTGLARFGPSPDGTAEVQAAVFVNRFVDRVVGVAGTPAGSAARQAATFCGREVLRSEPRLSRAVENGWFTTEYRLSNKVLCDIYKLFFERTLGEFVKSVVTAKIVLWLPGVYLVDPNGRIPDWVAEKVVSDILDPCQEQHRRGDEAGSVVDLARDLIEETVRRLFGLPADP